MTLDTIIILYALAGMLYVQIAIVLPMQEDPEALKYARAAPGIFLILLIIIVAIWPLTTAVDVVRFIINSLKG